MLEQFLQRYDDRKYKDAVRLALQSAVAAAATFSVMQAFGLSEKFVGVLSAVLVVQPSLGTTIGSAVGRLAATVVGCVIGVVCLFLLPDGYGTAAALAISMLVMNAVASFKPDWRYGVVAAVALALGAEANAVQIAIDRTIAIGGGVIMGILVSLIVWPERSMARAEAHIRDALRAAVDLLDSVIVRARGDEAESGEEARSRFLRQLSAARDTAQQVRIADNDSLKQKISAVEQYQRGMDILNSVAKQTDAAVEGDGSVADGVEEFRSLSSQIGRSLADGKVGSTQNQEELERCLKELRAAATRDDSSAISHVRRNALVFALDEVESSLEQLIELYREDSS